MHMGIRTKSDVVVGAAGAVPLWLIEGVAVSRDGLVVRFRDGLVRKVAREEALSAIPARLADDLQSPDAFAQARFDPELGTVTWPNGADLAPEFLRWGHHREEDCPCGGEHRNRRRN